MRHCGGYAVLAWLMCALHPPAWSSPAPRGVRSSVAFVSPPGAPVQDSVALRSLCTGPCRLTVQLLVSTSTGAPPLVLQTTWARPGSPRPRRTRLRLPPSLAFRRGFYNRHVVDARGGVLRAWVAGLNDSSGSGSYAGAAVRAAAVLRVTPPSQRPLRPPTGCPSWSAALLWSAAVTTHQCPQGAGVEHLLRFPAASTGERFGVVRTFHRFPAGVLEDLRRDAISQPRVTVSVWVYLLEWCRSKLCGIVLHVNREQEFDSLLMMLTNTGGLMIQSRLTSGEDKSFQAHASLPLLTWIRLDCSVHQAEVKLEMSWKNHSQTHTYRFTSNVHYDDTDGYFVMGGSRYMRGIYGYFGPAVVYRLGTTKVENTLGNTPEKLGRAHHRCQQTATFTHAFSEAVAHGDPLHPQGVCRPYYETLWRRSLRPRCDQTWSCSSQQNLRTLFQFLQRRAEAPISGPWGEKELGNHLFEYVTTRMFSADHTRLRLSPSLSALLQASCCLGHQHAALLMATVHLAGLGRPVDQEQGHVYSLMGALGDHRLALMHLGYKHSQGLDGFPRDLEVAYSCYANTATQTVSDDERPHQDHQHVVEHVYLDNQEQLRAVEQGASDMLHFLRMKARSGDVESQKQLASMSFWGQNGVTRDVAGAVRRYRKIALRMKDAGAIYDYAILLMKGQGVEKNQTESLRLLEKAIEMGSVDALNAVGWYYASVMKNVSAAIGYFQRAALNGSRDAVHNLGVYHLNGQHPDDRGKNQTAAFKCFMIASRAGHAAASVNVAWYLATGTLRGVARDVELAVRKLKTLSERNGHLGHALKTALRAYLPGSRAKALVGYLLCAETGLGLAQANSAHLCEELQFSPECRWRYTNYSVLNYDPPPSGLLKMGDYFYSNSADAGGTESSTLIGQAVSMYIRAASAGSPQGCFSLAALALDGHALPAGVRRQFNVSAHHHPDVLLEKILLRCVEMEAEGTLTPCSLALMRLRVQQAWRRMAQNPATICLTYAALLSLAAVAMVMPFQVVFDGGAARPQARGRSQGGPRHHDLTGPAPDGTPRAGRPPGPRPPPSAPPPLQRAAEAVVSVSGALLCAYVTSLLFHVL
ncbi:protein sel-1 homolog 3 [Gadus macrocephalus]|uniref:protein sel-1 homolog 3 n=1 Tax=Gadus macrocephalus TaxID=80720 RepID=UPI0028CB45D0|nr:protein sel-1 homolog 3 [Gadus macrocephalus]